mgnify:CR=1 FL=1
MTPDTLLPLIPPDWLALLHVWAPSVLAALTIATLLFWRLCVSVPVGAVNFLVSGDLFHYFLRWPKTHTVAIWADTQIIHYNRCALSRCKQCDFSANAPSSASHQNHFIIQASCHTLPTKLIVI